jgi:hypothetical protein
MKKYLAALLILLITAAGAVFSPPEAVQASFSPGAAPAGGISRAEGSSPIPCWGLYFAQRLMLDECWPMPSYSLPAEQPDPALAELPYHYLQVLNTKVPLYWTLDDAAAGVNSPRRLLPGFDYVSIYNQAKVSGEWFYLIAVNLWMPGDQAEYVGSASTFQGLEFERTPETGFGWVLYETESRTRPGGEAGRATGVVYSRYDPIQVYDVWEGEGLSWLLIKPGEWIPADKAAWQHPQTEPPRGVEGSRWISINLAEQILAVYEEGELVYATLAATGVEGFWTRPGAFRIKSKLEAETMRGSFAADRSDYYYLEDVPWTMYFDQSRALHGAYWHDQFGTPQSKGCVNLSPGDAHYLFQWAEEGDWVHVYDPSGQTPTDPDLYQAGGA